MQRTSRYALMTAVLVLLVMPLACGEDEDTSSDLGQPDQTQNPIEVAITAPDDGDLLNGVAEITVTVTGDVGQVDLLVDEEQVDTSTAAPFALSWDTNGANEGAHTLAVVAHPTAGGENVTSAPLTVTVDRTGPTTAFASTGWPVIFTGTADLQLSVEDANGVDQVVVRVGETELATLEEPPFETEWDTTGLDDGPVEVLIEATDRAGNLSTARLAGVVVNDGVIVELIEDSEFTWTIPANWRAVEYHARLHWEMPADVTHLMAVVQWDQPDWEVQLDVGTGVCPHNGVKYTEVKGSGGLLSVTHTAADLSLDEYGEGEMWFMHLGASSELTPEELDAMTLQPAEVAMTAILY